MNGRGVGRVMLAILLGVSLVLSGCSTSWVEEAEQIVAALIPASVNLVTLSATMQGKTVSAEDLATIQSAGTQASADLQLVQSLISAYEKDHDAARTGILNQIQSAMNAAQANLSGLLRGLHIKDAATQTKITALVGILLSEVQSLAAVVPMVDGAGTPKSQAFRQVGTVERRSSQARAPLSARDFVKSYNCTLTAKTGNAELDRASSGLQIHLHGRVERWASGGVLR